MFNSIFELNGDSLKEFANVELYQGLTVTTFDKKGKPKIIFKDPRNKKREVRYSNYSPLTESAEQ